MKLENSFEVEIKPWHPLDEETLLGKEFIELREKGLGDDMKYRYRESWTQLGAPQEWIANMSHTDPKEIYWMPDKFWLQSLISKSIPSTMSLVAAAKLKNNPSGKNEKILEAVRYLTAFRYTQLPAA